MALMTRTPGLGSLYPQQFGYQDTPTPPPPPKGFQPQPEPHLRFPQQFPQQLPRPTPDLRPTDPHAKAKSIVDAMPLDSVYDLLLELLNKRPEGTSPGSVMVPTAPHMPMVRDELPPVPYPPLYRSEPTVVGQDLHPVLKDLYRLAPEMRGQVSHIRQGPTEATQEDMVRSGLPPDAFEGTNLGGMADLKMLPSGQRKNEIAINPDIGSVGTARTLAHELAHVIGGPEQPHMLAYLAGAAYQRIREEREKKGLDPDTGKPYPPGYGYRIERQMVTIPRKKKK